MVESDRFPEFVKDWRVEGGGDFGSIDYLSIPDDTSIGVSFAIVAQWLYVPDFVEYRGGIFRAELPLGLTGDRRGSIDNWFASPSLGGNISKVEANANWLSLWDVFSSCNKSQHDEDLSQVVRKMARSWRALLRAEFPQYDFIVEIFDDESSHGPEITFYRRPVDEQKA